MKETKPTYKKQGNITLFDNEETMEKLNSMGNPLDKLSFRDFLGLASGDKVPDEKTIWAFKEELTKKGLFEEDRGGELWNPEEGDAEEEKKRKANKKRQKDTDARWVKKGGLQHSDKPGLQPVPVRASITSWNELTN